MSKPEDQPEDSLADLPTSPTSLAPEMTLGDNSDTPTHSKYSLLTELLPCPKWDAVLDKIYQQAWAAVSTNEEGGWKFYDEQKGVKIYLKNTEGSPIQSCKGIGTIDADIETIRCVFACAETRKEWDSMYGEGKVVELIDPNTVIAGAHFLLPWPLSSRDFCTVGRSIVLPNDGGVFVFFGSVDHPSYPPVKKYVRGNLVYSATLLTPNREDPSKTDVIYSVSQDPKGSIPKSLVDASNIVQPLCVATIRECIATKPTVVEQALQWESKKFKQALAEMKKNTQAVGATSANNGTDQSTPSGDFIPAAVGQFKQDDYTILVDPLSDDNLQPIHKEVLDTALQKSWQAIKDDDEGWTYHKELEGVKIWLKPSGAGQVKLSKGHGIINASPATVNAIFSNDATRKEWDSMFAGGRVLELFDANTFAGYAAFNAPFPLSGRDFTALSRVVLLSDGSIFRYSGNFVTPKCAPTKLVRGKLLFSGMLISPIEGGSKSKIIYAIGSDPAGDLPAAIAEAAALSQPLCIAAVAEFVSKKPDLVKKALADQRARLAKIINSDGALNISKETIPSIGSIEWPHAMEVDGTSEHRWLQPLHSFQQITPFKHITSSLSYAASHGGLFRAISPDYTHNSGVFATSTHSNKKDDSNILNTANNLSLGKFALKITHLRGKYLTVLGNMKLFFTISFEQQHIRTPHAPDFAPKAKKGDKDKENERDEKIEKTPSMLKSPITSKLVPVSHTLCCDITRPDAILNLELWGEQHNDQRGTVSSACLGALRLTIGELFEGTLPHSQCRGNNAEGNGDPVQARRFWLPLVNVPIEVDRTCTHHELLALKTKSGQKSLNTVETDEHNSLQYINDPRGLFVCFESCVLLSSTKLFFNDLLSLEQIHTYTTLPTSACNAMQLCLPPQLCKTPNEMLRIAHSPKNPELCTKVGQLAMTLTGGSLLTTDLNQDDLAQATSNFSAHLFIRNIIRFFFAVTPFINAANVLYDLFSWKSTIHTLFVIFLWVFVCYHPLFILPMISLFALYQVTMSAADHHFLQAAARANTTYAQALKQKYLLAQRYTEQLHAMIPTLSPRAQAVGVLVQVTTGRMATLLERVDALVHWTSVNDNALTMGIISVLTLLASIYTLFRGILSSDMNDANAMAKITAVSVIMPIILVVGWNSSIVLKIKHVVGSFLRARARLLHIRRESRTARLLTSEPKD